MVRSAKTLQARTPFRSFYEITISVAPQFSFSAPTFSYTLFVSLQVSCTDLRFCYADHKTVLQGESYPHASAQALDTNFQVARLEAFLIINVNPA